MSKKLKKILKKLDTSFLVVIVIGIIVMINFFSYNFFKRIDITENKDYSISQVTKKTLSEIDDIINIKAYFSKSLPSSYITLTQEVNDILDEYINFSNYKVRTEFISPEDDEETVMELNSLGIPQLQFNILEKDKIEVTSGYLGMVIQYGDKREVIPIVESTYNLEYQITIAIKKLTSDNMPIIGYIADNEEEMRAVFSKLREVYILRKINLKELDSIPFEIATLAIIGKDDLNEDDLVKIDEFLMRGRPLLVLSDGVNVQEGLIADVNDSKVNDFLEKYGVKINNNLILDMKSGFVTFSRGFLPFSRNYPLWPKISEQGFAQDNVAVSKLESIVFPWVSSITEIEMQTDTTRKISFLARTTNMSWEQTSNFNLDPKQVLYPTGPTRSHNLAVSVTGKLNSAYTDKSTSNGRLIVIADSDFVNDRYLRQSEDNLLFFQNLVDILSIDEDLINIRSKGVTDRPIKEVSNNLRIFLRYANVFGVTIIVIAFGLIRYYMRRKITNY